MKGREKEREREEREERERERREMKEKERENKALGPEDGSENFHGELCAVCRSKKTFRVI